MQCCLYVVFFLLPLCGIVGCFIMFYIAFIFKHQYHMKISLKKLSAARLSLYLVSIIFLFIILLVQQSCKKSDTLIDKSNKIVKDKTSENFFKLPANASPILQRIANELERQNKTKEFITAFIAKEGFPVWDKSRIENISKKAIPLWLLLLFEDWQQAP